jgi:aspartate aminotransferase-like enzyme
VRQAIARPVLNHRGPEFRAVLDEINRLQPIFGTANAIMVFSASGTGMMEASLINILAPGKRVLVDNLANASPQSPEPWAPWPT